MIQFASQVGCHLFCGVTVEPREVVRTQTVLVTSSAGADDSPSTETSKSSDKSSLARWLPQRRAVAKTLLVSAGNRVSLAAPGPFTASRPRSAKPEEHNIEVAVVTYSICRSPLSSVAKSMPDCWNRAALSIRAHTKRCSGQEASCF